MRERYGVVLAGGQGVLAGKIVRFGTMGDVREGDLLGAIGAIELTLADLDVAATPGAGTTAAIRGTYATRGRRGVNSADALRLLAGGPHPD